ncbi:MAG: hypothetical protein ABI947_23005 [Chloroflexota bacterium]
MLFQDDDQEQEEIIDTLCVGCDLPAQTNDLGLCGDCAAKLERDLIRSQDWEYSVTAFGVEPEKREALRQRVIQKYGANYELILPPGAPLNTPRKNKRSHSRATQHKREIAAQAQREYNTDDVLQAAQDFLRDQTEEWVNCSLLAQYLYERFYDLKPKRLGEPEKKYKSLLKFAIDYPSRFTLREDENNSGLYWICLNSVQ